MSDKNDHYCISNNKDYGKTIDAYGMSYQQICQQDIQVEGRCLNSGFCGS